MMEYPPLAEIVQDKWPSDVLARAKELQEEIGSIGAYSHSKGVPLIRRSVAKFISGMLHTVLHSGRSTLTPIFVQSAMVSLPTPRTSSSPLVLLLVSLSCLTSSSHLIRLAS